MDDLQEQAEDCRRKALCYAGQPEATFLLCAAREFERLSEQSSKPRRRKGGANGDKRRLG